MLSNTITQAVITCFALSILLVLAVATSAQAWLPAKGEGTLSFSYQKIDVRDHYDAEGEKEDKGRIHTHNSIMAFEYGLTDKLAFDFDLAYIASRYEGFGRRPHGPVDDGFYHPKFQDTHFGLRYNVLKRFAFVTPFVGFTIPTNNYEVRGHSAVGRGFRELVIGANVGRQLGPMLPRGYVHLRYSYAILKRFEGFKLNHSNVDWEAGWLANRLISFRFVGAWQKSHGGLEFPADVHLTADEFDIHDRVARVNYFQLGAGVTFSLSRSFDIHTAYAATVAASNTHGDGGIIVGFSWRFSRGSAHPRIAANKSSPTPPTLGPVAF